MREHYDPTRSPLRYFGERLRSYSLRTCGVSTSYLVSAQRRILPRCHLTSRMGVPPNTSWSLSTVMVGEDMTPPWRRASNACFLWSCWENEHIVCRCEDDGRGDPRPTTIDPPLPSIIITASPWLAPLVLLIYSGSSVFLCAQRPLRFCL
jgi:hypothetical protein